MEIYLKDDLVNKKLTLGAGFIVSSVVGFLLSIILFYLVILVESNMTNIIIESLLGIAFLIASFYFFTVRFRINQTGLNINRLIFKSIHIKWDEVVEIKNTGLLQVKFILKNGHSVETTLNKEIYNLMLLNINMKSTTQPKPTQ